MDRMLGRHVAIYEASGDTLRADIDSLGHASRIFGHCWDAQEFGTSCFELSSQFLSSVLA